MTDHLCDDVLINILKYLDLKSLLTFSAVSQQWARCVDKRCKVIKTLSTRKWPNEAHYNGHIWDEWHFWLETTGYKRDMILVNQLFNVQYTYFELNSTVFYRFFPLYRLCQNVTCIDLYGMRVRRIPVLTQMALQCPNLKSLYLFKVEDMRENKWKQFIELIVPNLHHFSIARFMPWNLSTEWVYRLFDMIMTVGVNLKEFDYGAMEEDEFDFEFYNPPAIKRLPSKLRKLKISNDAIRELIHFDPELAKQINELWIKANGGELQLAAEKFVNLEKLCLQISLCKSYEDAVLVHEEDQFLLDRWMELTKLSLKSLKKLESIKIYFNYSDNFTYNDSSFFMNLIILSIMCNLPSKITSLEIHNAHLELFTMESIVEHQPKIKVMFFNNVTPIYNNEVGHEIDKKFWSNLVMLKQLKKVILRGNSLADIKSCFESNDQFLKNITIEYQLDQSNEVFNEYYKVIGYM